MTRSGQLPIFKKHLASVTDMELQKALSSASSIWSFATPPTRSTAITQLDDIILKLEKCSDIKIKSASIEFLKKSKLASNPQEAYTYINKAENLLDSVNVAKGEYCTLYSQKRPLGRASDSGLYDYITKELNVARAKKDFSRVEEIESASYFSSDAQVSYKALKETGKWSEVSIDDFHRATKYNEMKEFIGKNHEDKELNNYLYKTYFLNGKDAPTYFKNREVLEKMYKKHGVYTFFDKEAYDTADSLASISRELDIWLKYSKNTAKLPKVFDITDYKYNFIKNISRGQQSEARNTVYLKRYQGDRDLSKSTLRHEIYHCNDPKPKSFSFSPSEEIMLERAGVDDVSYALVDGEGGAVFATANMKKLPQSLKERVVREEGFLEYVTKMPTHEEYTFATLLNQTTESSHIKSLQRLNNIFDGDIPVELTEIVLKDQKYMNVLDDFINKYSTQIRDFEWYEFESKLAQLAR